MNLKIKKAGQLSIVLFAFIILTTVIIAFLLPLVTAFSRPSIQFSKLSHILKIAIFTIKQAFFSTLIAFIIGFATAFFIAKRNFPGKQFLLSLSAIPLCIPSLIVALGYVGFFGMNGSLNRLLMLILNTKEAKVTFLYSFYGIILAQGFYNFPLVMSTIATAWEQLPNDTEEAARLLGASEWKIFYTITLPKLSAAITSSCIPVFLFCFFSFMIVTLFGSLGTTTLEVELYQAACSLVDFNKASAIAIIETVLAIIIVTSYTLFEKKGEKSTGIQIHFTDKENLKRIDLFFLIPIILLIIFFFLSPLFSIALSAFPDFSLKSARKVLFSSIFHRSIKNTILVSTATASISTIAAFTYAVFLRHSKNKLSIFRIIPILPMAVSSVVMGFGMLVLVSRGTIIHLIIAEAALTWPLAFRQLYIPLAKIKQETVDAAKMLSPSSLDIFFKIYLPNCKNNIFSAFIFCFASSAADTTLPLVLSIQKFDTLALYTYRLASSYRFSQASFCGLILGIICMLLFAISNKLKEEK